MILIVSCTDPRSFFWRLLIERGCKTESRRELAKPQDAVLATEAGRRAPPGRRQPKTKSAQPEVSNTDREIPDLTVFFWHLLIECGFETESRRELAKPQDAVLATEAGRRAPPGRRQPETRSAQPEVSNTDREVLDLTVFFFGAYWESADLDHLSGAPRGPDRPMPRLAAPTMPPARFPRGALRCAPPLRCGGSAPATPRGTNRTAQS